jgi:hypothetical protein
MALQKQKSHAFDSNIYLLGQDAEGTLYWLEEAKWDCDWYWGGGYVETYTNNERPAMSRDITSHSHFDSMFFNNQRLNGHDAFTSFFESTPFTDKEIWQICELMKSFYIARQYSDMLYCGGAHYTSNPSKDVIKNEEEYQRINTKVIPDIMKSLYEILGP